MFKSFFSAGFEGSTGINRHREWIDQVVATQHDLHLEEDYQRLRALGIQTVRESLRWPLIDRNGTYDLSTVDHIARIAREQNIEVIYDLFHFGYPSELDLFSQQFLERFEEYCYTVAKHLAANADGPYYFAPINEPSYFAWAAGDAGLFAPHLTGGAPTLKRSLIHAAIRGTNAIWQVLPEAQIISVDPICRVVAAKEEDRELCESFNTNAVFESWDMLSGKLHPEMGGSAKHLGIVGINYYWTNQWEWGTPGALPESDERHLPLRSLISAVWERYGAPMILSETSHYGENRPRWIREVAYEISSVLEAGLPLHAACIYPVLGMPEWHDRQTWTNMGLWDLADDGTGKLVRQPHAETMEAFRFAQEYIAQLAEPERIETPSLDILA